MWKVCNYKSQKMLNTKQEKIVWQYILIVTQICTDMYNYLPKLTKRDKGIDITTEENELEFSQAKKEKKKGPFDFRNKF